MTILKYCCSNNANLAPLALSIPAKRTRHLTFLISSHSRSVYKQDDFRPGLLFFSISRLQTGRRFAPHSIRAGYLQHQPRPVDLGWHAHKLHGNCFRTNSPGISTFYRPGRKSFQVQLHEFSTMLNVCAQY